MECWLGATGGAGATEGSGGSAAGAIATAAQQDTQGGQYELSGEKPPACCS